MKLLGQKNSINVRKVLWTCAELGIEIECEDWGGQSRSLKDPSFLAINPKARVPVLIDGNLKLSESNSICRYLVTHENNSDLLPSDPAARATVEAWMDWQISELNAAWRAAFMGRVRKRPDFSDKTFQEHSVADWNAAMTIINQTLEETDAYICGRAFTLGDIVLALSTNRWEQTPMERPKLPAINKWMHLLSARPAFATFCRNGVA